MSQVGLLAYLLSIRHPSRRTKRRSRQLKRSVRLCVWARGLPWCQWVLYLFTDSLRKCGDWPEWIQNAGFTQAKNYSSESARESSPDFPDGLSRPTVWKHTLLQHVFFFFPSCRRSHISESQPADGSPFSLRQTIHRSLTDGAAKLTQYFNIPKTIIAVR